MPRVWWPSERKRIETSVLARAACGRDVGREAARRGSAVTELPFMPAECRPTCTAVAIASPIAVPPKPWK